MSVNMSAKSKKGISEWYKQVLAENSSYLVENLTLGPLFYASLVQHKVFTTPEVEELEEEQTKSKIVWKLVKWLQKKSAANFSAFLSILQERGQKSIAEKLRADIKNKRKFHATERDTQENINKYVHANLGLSTHIPLTEQHKLTSDLVMKTDYDVVTSSNKDLLLEMEELSDDLKEEKINHKITRDQLNNMIKQNKDLQGDIQQGKKQNENLEAQFKTKIKELLGEKTELQQKLDEAREAREASRVERQSNTQPEQADSHDLDEMKEAYEREVSRLTKQVTRLQSTIMDQETELKAMNKKVYAIMNGIPLVEADSCEDDQMPQKMSSMECLDQVIAHFTAPRKTGKHKASKEDRQQLLKQINELNQVNQAMQEKQQQWDKERKSMQRNLNNSKQDIRMLLKKVEELNTPTPETRGRSDSLNSLSKNLPQVDMMQSFMVTQQQQQQQSPMKRQGRPVKRQESSDTLTSLPSFSRATNAVPMLSASMQVRYNNKPMECTVCHNYINQTQLITAKCQYHRGSFNPVQQRWKCCQQPHKHPGCTVSRHLPKYK